MTNVYHDRWGKIHRPSVGAVFRERRGAFFILYHNGCILLNYPNFAPDVLDLPGGGIDDGESSIQAAVRELKEESDLVIVQDICIDQVCEQFVRFAAEDVGEFWNYHQTFFLVSREIGHLYFEGRKSVEEGETEWISIDHLSSHTIHYMHALVLKQLGLMKE